MSAIGQTPDFCRLYFLHGQQHELDRGRVRAVGRLDQERLLGRARRGDLEALDLLLQNRARKLRTPFPKLRKVKKLRLDKIDAAERELHR